MRAWFILAEASKYDPKWAARVPETAFWNDTEGNWNSSIATPYQTKEEAEELAVFLAAKIMNPKFQTTVTVLTFEEVKDRYGINIDPEGSR